MSFAEPEEWRLLKRSLDEFIEQEVRPLEAELGETYDNPRLAHRPDGRPVEPVVGAIETVRRRSAAAGFYAMNMPGSVGGEGVSNVTWYRANRHVAARGPGLPEYVLAGPEESKPLLSNAEGEQVGRYL